MYSIFIYKMFVIFTKFTTLFSDNIVHLIKIRIVIILVCLSKCWLFTGGFRKSHISSRRKHFGDSSGRHRLYFQQKKKKLLAKKREKLKDLIPKASQLVSYSRSDLFFSGYGGEKKQQKKKKKTHFTQAHGLLKCKGTI